MESIEEFNGQEDEVQSAPEEVVKPTPKRTGKIKMRKVTVLKSISAPYLTNISKGETVKIPSSLYEYYKERGIVAPIRRTKKEFKNGN